jgi:5-methylcytosine-specific restriction protein A
MRFYVTKAWKLKRLERLARDNYLCQRCKKRNLLTPATMVHHIKPLEDYPELALEIDNLISLCNNCHEQITNRRTKSKRDKIKTKARVIISKAEEVRI